jgi:hypothetical protein
VDDLDAKAIGIEEEQVHIAGDVAVLLGGNWIRAPASTQRR